MAMTTIRVAHVDPDAPRAVPETPLLVAGPILGAGVAAIVAAGATLIGAYFGAGEFLAIGIPAAASVGWFLAPNVRSAGWPAGTIAMMATLTVAVADAIFVVALIVGSAMSGSVADPVASVLVGFAGMWVLGLFVVGVPALVITIPAAIVWAVIVRQLAKRGIGARPVVETPA